MRSRVPRSSIAIISTAVVMCAAMAAALLAPGAATANLVTPASSTASLYQITYLAPGGLWLAGGDGSGSSIAVSNVAGNGLHCSPDGGRAVVLEGRGDRAYSNGISVLDLGTGQKKAIDIGGIPFVTFDSWFPDGDRFIYTSDEDNHGWLVDASTGTRQAYLTGSTFRISPDGKYVAYVSGGSVYSRRISDSNLVKLCSLSQWGSEAWVTEMEWSPDSQRVFISINEGGPAWDHLVAYTPGGSRSGFWASGKTVAGTVQDISPDGSEVLVVNHYYYPDSGSYDTFGVVQTATGDSTKIGPVPPSTSYAFFGEGSFSPDGSMVAFEKWVFPVGVAYETQVWTMNADGSAATRIAEDAQMPSWRPMLPMIAGATRYDTAIEASKEAFPAGAGAVVIATGANWPDALGGAALAGAKNGPILLTPAAALPAGVLAEIKRLGASEAYILGGTGAVSAAVESALATELGAGNVTRIGGSNRYSTAEMIASAVIDELGASYDGKAFVGTGANFPDALAGSPLAAAGPWPIFLVPSSGVSPATLSAMDDAGVTDALILGGTGAVSSSSESALTGEFGAEKVTRLAGGTRYETAVAVATYGVGSAGLEWDGVALATGGNFPDALAGGVLQGRAGSVLLLTHPTELTASAEQALSANRDSIDTAVVLGGPGAVSSAVHSSVMQAIQ